VLIFTHLANPVKLLRMFGHNMLLES